MSNRVGPIIFANPRAREQFITGEVVTFRAGEKRTTGDTHARWERTGKAMADAHVEHLSETDPRDDEALIQYVGPRTDLSSGFANVPMWRNAMGDVNDGLPDTGHLYRVALQRVREPMKEYLRSEYGLSHCDGCEARVAPHVREAGGSVSGQQPNGIPASVSWCAWDGVGIRPEGRPEGWRFQLPEDGFPCPDCGEEQTPRSLDVTHHGAPERRKVARCGSCGSELQREEQ